MGRLLVGNGDAQAPASAPAAGVADAVGEEKGRAGICRRSRCAGGGLIRTGRMAWLGAISRVRPADCARAGLGRRSSRTHAEFTRAGGRMVLESAVGSVDDACRRRVSNRGSLYSPKRKG